MAQSCLETRSIDARHKMMSRSDYQRGEGNEYSATHEDAQHNSGPQGKGTAHNGHSHWLPDCTKDRNVFNYSNFDTDPKSEAGNTADNEARAQSMTRSIYSSDNSYATVDTSANVADGQYVVP